MSEKRDEIRLDKLINKAIDTSEPQFDAGKWRAKHSEELNILASRGKETPVTGRKSVFALIWRSRIVQLAAAAVVIIAAGVLLVYQGPVEPGGTEPRAAQDSAQMTTAMSLTMAFRVGGLEALESQCDEAVRTLGPNPAGISLPEVLGDSNG